MKKSFVSIGMNLLFGVTVLIGASSARAQDLEIQVEDLALMPVPSHLIYPTEILVDDKVYYFGGNGAPSTVLGYDEIWELDVTTGLITELPFKMPYELAMAPHVAAVHVDGHIYMSPGFASGDSGGWGSHRRVIDVDLGAGVAAETFAFPPSRIWAASAVAANGKVYFLGGWTGSPQATIFELDPQAGTFAQVAVMIGASNDVVPTLGSDGWIYYWGRLLPDIQRFNPTTYQVESTGLAFPIGGGGVHTAYMRWHDPGAQLMYFVKPGSNEGPSSPLYRYNYGAGAGTITDMGVFVPQDLVNQRTTLDPNDPSVIYAYRLDTDFSQPLYVSKVTLAPSCLYGPENQWTRFERFRGKPEFETFGWESCGGAGEMIVVAAGVSSAYLYLNGELILGPSDFHGDDVKLEIPVLLLEGRNTLDAKLRGSPDDTLEIRFEAN